MTSHTIHWRWIAEALALALLGFCIAFPLSNWSSLPNQVPVHFGFNGQPDRWGSPSTLWISPCVATGVWILFSLASRNPSLISMPVDMDRSRPEVRAILRELALVMKPLVLSLFAIIIFESVETALGRRNGLSPWLIPVHLVCLLTCIAFYYVRLRRIS
jgi:uncharacterized membrane protein